jgi:hypothetical protein
MKLGYSMLLGEHIKAPVIGYSDCKDFQIVCPACKEPIFKAVRAFPVPPIHYLSHYVKSKAYETQCELRVSSMSASDLAKHDAESRGQRLIYFLSVIRGAVLSLHGIGRRGEAIRLVNLTMSAPGPQLLRDAIREELLKADNGDVEKFVRSRVEAEIQYNNPLSFWPKTPFAKETQIRIAVDIIAHLLSPIGMGTFTFLIGCAYLHLLVNSCPEIAKDPDFCPGYWAEVNRAFDGLRFAGRGNADVIIGRLRDTKVAKAEMSLLSLITTNLWGEVVIELASLSYFDMLKRRKGTGR